MNMENTTINFEKSVLYIACIHGNTLINTNILYGTTIYTKCYVFMIGYFL